MAGRTVTLRITGTSKELQAALAEAGLAADEASAHIGDKLAGAGEKAAGGFSRIGQAIQNFTGLPVADIFDKIASKFDSLDSKGQKLTQAMSTLGGATLAAGAVGFAAAGVEAIHMADAFDTAQASLQTAVKNSGNSWSQFSGPIEDAYGKMAQLGFNSTETAQALTSLTTATGSPTKAISDLSVAADLARLKHISLTDASGILTKTLAGSTRALTSLGINLDIGSAKLSSMHTATQTLQTAQMHLSETQQKIADGSLKGVAAQQALENAQRSVQVATENLSRDQKAGGDIMDALHEKTKGAASAFGQTLPGQIQIAKAQIQDLGVKFGEWLTPKITEAMKAVEAIVGWFEKHKVVAEALGVVIGGVLAIAVATFAVNTGVKMVKSVQQATESLGKLVTKIPEFISGLGEAGAAETEFSETSEATGAASSAAFGPVGIAIMAIVAIGTLVATHWQQVKEVLLSVWNGIKEAAVAVWDFIKEHIKVIVEAIAVLVTGGIGALALLIYNNWSKIKADAVAAWDAIVSFFTSIPSKIVGALSALGSDIAGVVLNAFHMWEQVNVTAMVDVLNFFESIPGKILGVLGSGLKVLEGWGSDLVHGIVHGIESAASDIGHALEDAIKSGWNAVKGAINSIPVIGGALGAIGLATGGYVTKPTFAVVGEAGPEFVIPEAQLKAEFAAGISPLPDSFLGGGGGGGLPMGAAATPAAGPTAATPSGAPGTSVTQYFNVESNATPQDLAHSVSVALRLAGIS